MAISIKLGKRFLPVPTTIATATVGGLCGTSGYSSTLNTAGNKVLTYYLIGYCVVV